MVMRAALFLVAAFSPRGTTAWDPPLRHEITSLPGLKGPLPSKMRNGWVNAGKSPKGDGDMFFHYWIVDSERNPAKDPVVFWWQGGPGASSLFGLMQEFGPLMLNALSYDESYNSTGIPSLIPNPWSWTKEATIVAVDNPPPTGFSFCTPEGPSGRGYSCGNWTDTLTAEANHGFLNGFFKEFPEYHDNDIFITGESYGGIYVPVIVEQVMDKPVPGMNLKGYAIIDGQYPVEGHASYSYYVDFMHGHGQFSNALYYEIQKVCNYDTLRVCNRQHCPVQMQSNCQKLLNQMDQEVGGYYGYNLYDECPHAGPFKAFRNGGARLRGPSMGASCMSSSSSPCPLSALIDWMALNQTHAALGLAKDAVFFDTDNGVGFNYKSDHTQASITAVYTKAVTEHGLRVLSINGGTDPGTDGSGQDAFVKWAAGLKLQQTQSWRPWTVDGAQHVGGHLMEWKPAKGGGSFVWSRVRGSGHMVPEYKPLDGKTLLSHFIAGTDFPHYKPN